MKTVTKKITTVTPLEMDILNEVEAWDLNDGTQECFYAPIHHGTFDMKVYRGVIASLVKKGIVSIDNCWSDMTEIVISKKHTGIHKDGHFVIANVEGK